MADPEELAKKKEEDLDNEIRKTLVPIPNKKSEPKFKMEVKPDKCVIFRSDDLLTKFGFTTFTVTNSTGKRQALKIKGTNRMMLDCLPLLVFMEPNETAKMQALCSLRVADLLQDHYFLLYHSTVEDKTITHWAKDTKPEGVKKLKVVFVHSDNKPWSGQDLIRPEDLKTAEKLQLDPITGLNPFNLPAGLPKHERNAILVDALRVQLAKLEAETVELEKIYAQEVKNNDYWREECRKEIRKKMEREEQAEAMNKKKDGTGEKK